MKKIFTLISVLLFLLCGVGCGYQSTVSNDSPAGSPAKYEILTEIVVTNGDKQFDGVLYDNETAREFAKLLPITAGLWDPAKDFAKAINLEEKLNASGNVTREYELGGLVYWPSGSSVAFFYNNNLSQTIVPVIPFGKLNDISEFRNCEGEITITEKTVSSEESEINSSSADSGKGDETQEGNGSESYIVPEESSTETVETNGDTLRTAIADPGKSQTLYIWEEGNMPAATEYTVNNGGYADDPDFRPYIVTFPVPDGTPIKGAVLINAGGAFQYRSDQNEGTPVAQELSRLGYQSFVVNYRLRPYTQQEGALDLARAVRFVRKNAEIYGIDEKDIAVMGFSAGGILAGEMLLNFDGTVNGTALDAGYQPDSLDEISADASACGMIYSFYGRLSFASDDVEQFRASDLPPTYFCYGTRDPFVSQFEKCIAALREAGVSVDDNVLEGRPHGYGYTQGWIPAYDRWLEGVFA